jgi:tRNA threonylcarbamoyl adenosine modification protein YeaZ
MTTLAIEASTATASVALVRDDAVLFSEAFPAERGHTGAMFTALQTARAMIDDCDRMVVGLGPGSYSGVRIAIAAAVGMRYALGAELLGVTSLAALDAPEYHAVGDARRGTFYFAHIRDGECLDGPRLLSREEVLRELSGGASEGEPALPVLVPAPIDWLPQAVVSHPRAVTLAQLAAREKSVAMRGDLEPLYLRDPHITLPKKVAGLISEPPKAP